MKVFVYPADMSGCGYYRLIWPARALRAQGHDVTVVLPEDRADPAHQLSASFKDGRVVDVAVPEGADVIVVQRVSHQNLAAAIPTIRAKGVTVVVDMDDDLTRVHPSNPAFSWLHPKNGTSHNWVNASLACGVASWVTTSTPELQRVYAPSGNGSVLYNMVEARALELPVRKSASFGWTGNLRSHPDDPRVTGSTVQRLVNEGFPFYMVGNPEGVAREFRLAEDQVGTSGPVDSAVWLDELSALKVGMAPLADTRFNASKSWLKPLELAATGVPCVMSPRAEYRRLHAEHGIGELATSAKDWYRLVRALMTDEPRRLELAQRSREAAAKLTVEDNAWRWMEAWTRAYEREH